MGPRPPSSSNLGTLLVTLAIVSVTNLGIGLGPTSVDAERRCKYTSIDQGVHKDIESVSGIQFASDCCNKCLADPKCVAFTQIGLEDRCYTKYDTTPAEGTGLSDPIRLVSGIVVEIPDEAVRVAIEAAPRKSCDKIEGRQLDVYHDIRSYDEIDNFEACCDLCKDDIDCKAINWNTDKKCWLKYSDGPIVPDVDVAGLRTDTGIIRISPLPPVAAPIPARRVGAFHMKYKELTRES